MTEVTNPYDCSELCVSSGQDLTRRPPLLLGAEPAMRQGATSGLPKKRNRAPISGGRVVLTQFVQMYVAFQLRAGCVFLERFVVVCSHVVF